MKKASAILSGWAWKSIISILVFMLVMNSLSVFSPPDWLVGADRKEVHTSFELWWMVAGAVYAIGFWVFVLFRVVAFFVKAWWSDKNVRTQEV